MKTTHQWKILVACVLFGLAVSMPIDSFAQSKSKTSTHRSTTKAKKKVRSKSIQTVAAKTVKAKVPKSGVMTIGAFRPLKSDDRMTVVLPRRPATRANLTSARNRTTVFTDRTITASAQTFSSMTARNFPTTAVVVNARNTNWWGNGGPPSVSRFDTRYGWITTVGYSWGNVMYTYGYQVVNYWNGNNEYVWIAYPGVAGVAYPVIYR